MATRPPVHIVIQDDFYHAAFCLDGGEMLETVTTKPGGRWDWDEAGIVDFEYADDPVLCGHIHSLLTYMEEQYAIRKQEETAPS